MVKELMHDPIFLARKSSPATREDLQIAQDLLDTLTAHKGDLRGYGGEYDRRNETDHCV